MRKIQTCIILTPQANDIIKDYAKALRYSKSELIELATLQYIEAMQRDDRKIEN